MIIRKQLRILNDIRTNDHPQPFSLERYRPKTLPRAKVTVGDYLISKIEKERGTGVPPVI